MGVLLWVPIIHAIGTNRHTLHPILNAVFWHEIFIETKHEVYHSKQHELQFPKIET